MSSTEISALEGLKQSDYLTGTLTYIWDLVISRRNIVALFTIIAYDYGG